MKKTDFEDLILDGALGSLLYERSGKPAGYVLEKLNIENPEIVKKVHEDYIKAGAQLIYTNTFGANSFKLKEDYSVEQTIKAAVDIALDIEVEHLTALDIGPLGKIIDSDITFEEAFVEFSGMIEAGGDRTDAIVIETMTDFCEMRAALLAAKAVSKLPVMASLSFNADGVTLFGNSVESFVALCERLGVSAVGCNCSLGPSEMAATVKKLLECSSLPVFIKPNAGIPYLKEGKTVYPLSSEEFSAKIDEFRLLGVSIVGGCCGTTPEFIEKLAESKVFEKQDLKDKKEKICSMRVSAYTDGIHSVSGLDILPDTDADGMIDEIAKILEESPDAVVADFKLLNDTAKIPEIVGVLSRHITQPLVFDVDTVEAQEIILRCYNGVAGVIKRESLSAEINEKYGAVWIN